MDKYMKRSAGTVVLIIVAFLGGQFFGNDDEELQKILDYAFSQEVFENKEIIEVYGGDTSGYRESNVAVDIGYGNREYWGFTNDYGQLILVIAKEIIPQDDYTEAVLSTGRYYPEEAFVDGVESKKLDQGHVIADSLGGVANAYNITPQNSYVNRKGAQAQIENQIRNAGGCNDFVVAIEYPNTETQIPSKYSFIYRINGILYSNKFENKR